MLNKTTTTQPNLSKCTTNNTNLTVNNQLTSWPPSTSAIDALVLKLKAKDGDTEANWKNIILKFKKEIQEEEQQRLNPPSCSGVDNNNNNNNNSNNNNNNSSNNNNNSEGSERREKVRARFCVPLSRKEMEKDFEDMGERRLPRKPKKRPKVIQNQLDTLFPGLWLTEIHADLYRVSETKKR